jgi:hypothetical protein
MPVFTANTHPENQFTRSKRLQIGQLPRHEHRVSQGQQIDTQVNPHLGSDGVRRSGTQQAIHAKSDEETNMIADHKMVEARIRAQTNTRGELDCIT